VQKIKSGKGMRDWAGDSVSSRREREMIISDFIFYFFGVFDLGFSRGFRVFIIAV